MLARSGQCGRADHALQAMHAARTGWDVQEYTNICIYLYGSAMTKRLVDIDDASLLEAQRILETRTMKETVNEALRLMDFETT